MQHTVTSWYDLTMIRIGDRMALLAMQATAQQLTDALEEFFCTGKVEHLRRARAYLKSAQEADSLHDNGSFLDHIINDLEGTGDPPCDEN